MQPGRKHTTNNRPDFVTQATTPDAIELLDAEHLALHASFATYRELVLAGASPLQRRALAEEICLDLTIHARLEEELFHPAVSDALGDVELLEEAQAEGGELREMVAQILAGAPEDPLYDARVQALAGYVERHVGRERERVFNRAAASGLDLHGLARRIARRREELRSVADALREHTLATALA